MLNCNDAITGYTRQNCLMVSSGVKKFYVGAFSADTTSWTRNSENVITSGTNTPTFYAYEMLEGTASATETLVVNGRLKTVGVTQAIEMIFIGQSQTNRNTYNQLLSGAWSVIVQSENTGEYVLFGEDRGMERSEGSATFGVEIDSDNEMRLSLSCRASDAADTIDSAFVAALIA